MPLIPCRDCGTQVSDAAAACVKCGCPIVQPVAPRPTAYGEKPDYKAPATASLGSTTAKSFYNKYQCPNCQSTDVKLLPIVHGSGTSSIKTSTGTVGIGYAGGGFGIGGASSSTSGTQQTDLARMLPPPIPTKPDKNGTAVACVVMLVVVLGLSVAFGFGGFAFGLLALALVMGATISSAQTEAEREDEFTYKPAYARWRRSFLCGVCMRVTDPGE